jgi:hypothetical protein
MAIAPHGQEGGEANPSRSYLDEEGLFIQYGIPSRTAQRWRSTGDGPRFVRLGKRRIIYRIADVEDWLAERTYCSHADELSRNAPV